MIQAFVNAIHECMWTWAYVLVHCPKTGPWYPHSSLFALPYKLGNRKIVAVLNERLKATFLLEAFEKSFVSDLILIIASIFMFCSETCLIVNSHGKNCSDFLRTGCQDREYSFAEFFFFFLSEKKVCSLGSIFFQDSSKKINGTCCPCFPIFCKFLSNKCFHAFFVKSNGLCQLLQFSTDFDEILRIYFPKLGMI